MVTNQVSHYSTIDKKELNASVEFVMYPALLLTTVNWKLELCLTFPLTLIAMYVTTKVAFTTEDGNMACYVNGEALASSQNIRSIIQLVILGYAIHDNRKTQIKRFIAQKRAEQ